MRRIFFQKEAGFNAIYLYVSSYFMTSKARLAFYVEDFKNWRRENYTDEQIAGNDFDDPSYPKWNELEDFFSHLLDTGGISRLDEEDKTNLLYLIARGFDNTAFLSELSEERPLSLRGNLKDEDFLDLAKHAATLQGTEYDDAKASLAMCFRKFEYLTSEMVSILLALYNDKQEYTKRMALLSLAKFGYENTLTLVQESWKIEDEWHKMACLSILKEYVKDEVLFAKYAEEAMNDSRQLLREYAQQLQKKNNC